MKIIIHRKTEYKGYKIIIRQIGNTMFEYLFTHNRDIYSHHVLTRPGGLRRSYNAQEKVRIAKILISGATVSIDELIKAEDNKGNGKK